MLFNVASKRLFLHNMLISFNITTSVSLQMLKMFGLKNSKTSETQRRRDVNFCKVTKYWCGQTIRSLIFQSYSSIETLHILNIH